MTSRTTALRPAISRGSQINRLHKLREKARVLNAQLKEVNAEKAELELEVIEDLEREGVTQASTKTATVTVSEEEVAVIEDWDKFNAFVKRNNAFELYYRRVNNASFRELATTRRGGSIPGASTRTIKKLSLRSK